MTILGICDSLEVLKVLQIVRTVITIIKIVVPILLLLACTISFVKAVKNDDELDKVKKGIVSKVIAAMLIFFIPTFVNMIGKMASVDTSEFAKCIQNSTDEKIEEIQGDRAEEYLERLRNSLSLADYSEAYSIINKLKESERKNQLMERLNILKSYVDLKDEIYKLAKNYDSKVAKTLYEKVNAISDEVVKEKLLAVLEEAEVGKPLNVAAGSSVKTYKGMKYFEIMPEDATTRMPLVIYLVGGNPHGMFNNIEGAKKNEPTRTVLSGDAYKYEKFIYIAPDYTANSTKSFQEVKELIDHVVEEYSIDQDRIIVTGVSNGAVATYWLGYTYPNYFSAVVPLCGPAYDYTPPNSGYTLMKDYQNTKAGSFVSTSLWSMTAGRYDFGNYEKKAQELNKKIHAIDPNAKALYSFKADEFTNVLRSELGKEPSKKPTVAIYQHCTIMVYYSVPELWEWMLKQ